MVGKNVIIWDWNGTLLDDTDLCIGCMNQLLEQRKLPKLHKPQYREIFTFPVKSYYQKAGFDFSKEDFEVPAMEFIDLYYQRLSEAKLFPDAIEVLQSFYNMGFYQTVLSAMEHDSLILSLKDKGVENYFDRINGIDDHYAHSKLEMGRKLIEGIEAPLEKMLIIGDTLHDLEVGDGLGVDVLLVANGHQSASRLRKETENVIDDLQSLKKLINKPFFIKQVDH